LNVEERELAREIETLTRKLSPQLLEQPGVGPLAAAQVLISWSHRGWITDGLCCDRLAPRLGAVITRKTTTREGTNP
jgi:transposase